MPGEELETIRHTLRIARERGFREVALEVGDLEFEAILDPGAPVQTHVNVEHVDEPELPLEPPTTDIVAASVGYFKAGPTALSAGRVVQKGDLLGSISALGISNDLESPVGGEIVEAPVSDGQPVQFGQVLARIKVSP